MKKSSEPRAKETNAKGTRENAASVRLEKAIQETNPAAVRKAIRDGASLRALPERRSSPLALAVVTRDADWPGKAELQQLLGIPVVRRKKGGWRGCVHALVEAGCPVNGFENEDPMIVTCIDDTNDFYDEASNIEAIKLLLELGADINACARGPLGQTALHKAAFAGQVAVVKYLVSRGADVNATNHRGQSPLALLEAYPDYPNFIRPTWKEIIPFLRDAVAGRADVSFSYIDRLAKESGKRRVERKQAAGRQLLEFMQGKALLKEITTTRSHPRPKNSR